MTLKSLPLLKKERKKEKILVISVREGKSKPYKCSSGFYYRSGSTSQKLTTSEIREFMEREDLINFDTVRCKEFIYSKHFDKEKLFSFLDRAKVTYKKKDQLLLLKNLKVAKKIKEKLIFNNAGALFFSKNLEDIYSHTKVSCAIFRGTERIKILDRKIYNKDILSNIEDALLYLGAHLRTEYNLTGAARREEILEIPEKALREALVNAVTHRDYLNQAHVSVEIHYDRVEITNLGGLPKGLNKQNFGKISVPRNPLIAGLMLKARYIEGMGTGIRRMKDMVKKAGLKPIKFKFGNFFTIIFPRNLLYPESGTNGVKNGTNGTNSTKNDSEESIFNGKNKGKLLKILDLIESNDFSIEHFMRKQRIARRTLLRHLKLLKDKGFIFTEGSTKATKYKVTEKYKKLKKKL